MTANYLLHAVGNEQRHRAFVLAEQQAGTPARRAPRRTAPACLTAS